MGFPPLGTLFPPIQSVSSFYLSLSFSLSAPLIFDHPSRPPPLLEAQIDICGFAAKHGERFMRFWSAKFEPMCGLAGGQAEDSFHRSKKIAFLGSTYLFGFRHHSSGNEHSNPLYNIRYADANVINLCLYM